MTSSHSESKTAPSSFVLDEPIRLALTNNGLSLEVLSEENKDALQTMLKVNEKEEGFIQMEGELFTGEKLDQLLAEKNDKCLIIRQASTQKVIGFVIYGESNLKDEVGTPVGVIIDLGVDLKFTKGKAKDVRSPGASLLFLASHDLFRTSHLKSIEALASTDDAGDFYKKMGFEVREGEEDLNLTLTRENFLNFEKGFFTKSAKPIGSSLLSSEDKKATHQVIFHPRKKIPAPTKTNESTPESHQTPSPSKK